MKTWIIVAMITGLLMLAGFVFVINTQTATAADQTEAPAKSTCAGCGNGYSAGSNCGLATCGAMKGGQCNCGAK